MGQTADSTADSAGAAVVNSAGLSNTQKPTFSVVPRLSLTQTFTDNASLSGKAPRADQITDIAPGLRITSDGPRLKAYFDYSLRELIYAQGTSNSTTQNSLNTFGTLRAIDNWAFLDFSSTISQQAISAFGTQSDNNGTVNANLTETSTTRLSPYLQGQLPGGISYMARYDWSVLRSKSSLASDSTMRNGLIQVNGERGPSLLSWSLSATRQDVDYDKGRSTSNDSVSATVTYQFSPQLSVYGLGRRESNNYLSLDKETHSNTGWGFNWIPSDVTKLSVSRENRYSGESHSLRFEHRSGRTAWQFSDVRDVSANPSQGGTTIGTLYDLLFAQFAGLEPDPVKRAGLVNNFLQVNGLNPAQNVVSGFLPSAVTLQRRQDLNFVIRGLRDTIAFTATQSQTSRLDAVATAQDDLSNSNNVKQRGFSANLAHLLTPESSINLTLSRQDALGTNSVASPDTMTKSMLLNFSTRIGVQSSVTMGARRVLFEGGTTPYSETAVTGSLNLQF